MEIINTKIPDLIIIKPSIYKDDRGYFFESFNREILSILPEGTNFVQDNESCSSKGTIRGFHFQSPPYEQGKLVRIIKGGIIDVAVDLRKNSPWYGQFVSVELNEDNKLMFWIPPGFGHGFQSLEDETILSYKCTNYYNKQSDGGIIWNDKTIGMNWPIQKSIISEKDSQLICLEKFESPFIY